MLAVLLILTVIDEDVLSVEHVIALMTILGLVITICRVLIPNEVCQVITDMHGFDLTTVTLLRRQTVVKRCCHLLYESEDLYTVSQCLIFIITLTIIMD